MRRALQVHLIMLDAGAEQYVLPGWKVLMFQLFTVLSYANSAVNPLLYVFVNDTFRQNCLAALGRRAPRSQPPVVVVGPPAAPVSAAGCRPVVVRLSATSTAAAGVVDVELHASLQ